jgi:putative ABC transport system permease protein
MGKVVLVCRLAARDLRHHPVQAVLLLVAITAATVTLTLGLALHGVTRHPYQQTRAATNGPDLVAQITGPAPGPRGRQTIPASQVQAQVRALIHLSGATGHSGPYPVASAFLRVHGHSEPVVVEGRDQAAASIEQPKLTAGRWVRPGGVVVERTYAEALGIGVGSRVTLNGRPFTVAGIAVTAAAPPYPNLCIWPGGGTCGIFDLPSKRLSVADYGLAWTTQPDARAIASPTVPLWYFLNLRLGDPAQAQALATGYDNAHLALSDPVLISWQSIAAADGLLVQDEQQVLTPAAWLLCLLAIGSVAVLVGGRMAEHTRRVGLLKAVGSTPELVAATLLAENLALALVAAAAGLGIGWLAAPLVTNPGTGLVGTPGAPSLTPASAAQVAAVALAVALAATLVPALRAARTSTVTALADAARPPRRRARLIAVSRMLPVPLLLGLRLVGRRPRRAALSAASVAVTVAGIVAVLAFHATGDQRRFGGTSGLANPVVLRDGQLLLVLTAALLALAAINAVFTAWATVLDTRRASALVRALGASPRQVSAGLSAAQALPALPGAIIGIPAGIALFAMANSGGVTTVPPLSWLLAAVLVALVAVAGLTTIPARLANRHPPGEILRSETG